MKVEFVRFKASDKVELQGWLSEVTGETAAIHIHGMSGNGYENYFLDSLREMFNKNGISFFSFDNRGHGIISEFSQGSEKKLGGSCFEIFEESEADIQGAIDYLKTLGKTKFILEGHSLGGSKVVNYYLNNPGTKVEKLILLAPTDMTGWAEAQADHAENLAKAKQAIESGRPKDLAGAQCWVDKTPISAATYLSICEAGSPADMYGPREGGPLLYRVEAQTLIIYGDSDGGITMVDGSIDNYLYRVKKLDNPHLQVEIIEGSKHSYQDHEMELAESVEKFITK